MFRILLICFAIGCTLGGYLADLLIPGPMGLALIIVDAIAFAFLVPVFLALFVPKFSSRVSLGDAFALLVVYVVITCAHTYVTTGSPRKALFIAAFDMFMGIASYFVGGIVRRLSPNRD